MDFTCILPVLLTIIGLQLSAQIDASIVKSPPGCTLDGKHYKTGDRTKDRCIQYQCIDGGWEYYWTNIECGHCESQGKTTITTYDKHSIGGFTTSSYKLDGSAGAYCFTQRGLETHSNLGVAVTFNSENDITNVFYAETGITVQFVSPGPDYYSKILVNGTETQLPYGPLKELPTTVGTTVWLTNDGVWPPLGGGNIQIVGSQGLTVSIWAYQGYAAQVNSYAMRSSMKNHTYGLCDVFTKGLPKGYTMLDGEVTTSIDKFTQSWKVSASSPACSCAWRREGFEPTFAGCHITEAAPSDKACRCSQIDPLPDKHVNPICVATLVPCKDPTSPHCIKPGTGLLSCEEGQGNCGGYPIVPPSTKG